MRARRPRVVRHVVAGAVVAVYLLAAAVVVLAHRVAPMPEWLALHLLVLGAATNAVFVWRRHFGQALLHARPGPERPAQLRLGALNAGVVAVLAGACAGGPPLAVAGAAVVVGAVIAHVASLLAMARPSSSLAGPLGRGLVLHRRRYRAGVRRHAGRGAPAGLIRSPGLQTAVVLAHAHLNLLGWLGLAIIGTQFMLWPMVLRTRMSQDAPRAARRVFAVTACGLAVTTVALLAAPWLGGAHWLAAAGMACYGAGAAYSLAPAVREMRARPPHTAAAWALLAGNAWLLAALIIDTTGLAAGLGEADHLLGRLLIPVLGVGVIAQALRGALTFLLPVTVGGGPARQPAADRDSRIRVAQPGGARQRRGAGTGRAARRRVADRRVGGGARRVRHIPGAGGGRARGGPPGTRAQPGMTRGLPGPSAPDGDRSGAAGPVFPGSPTYHNGSVSTRQFDVNCRHGRAGTPRARRRAPARPEPEPRARPAAQRRLPGRRAGGRGPDRAASQHRPVPPRRAGAGGAGRPGFADAYKAGRPSTAYRPVEGGGAAGQRRYRLLAEMLTSLIAGVMPEPGEAAMQAGREWGRYLTRPPGPLPAAQRRQGRSRD